MSHRSISQPPLKPVVFQILLVLAEEERHGLGIADAVEREGGIRLGPGTLYRSLKEMSASGLLQEVSARRPDEDPRRKFYRLTPSGHRLLAAEAARYEHLVRAARRRKVLPEEG